MHKKVVLWRETKEGVNYILNMAKSQPSFLGETLPLTTESYEFEGYLRSELFWPVNRTHEQQLISYGLSQLDVGVFELC